MRRTCRTPLTDTRPITNESDCDPALQAIDALMDAAPSTPRAYRLEALMTLVEAYESRRWPVEAPDPVSMTEHDVAVCGSHQKDLAVLIGSQPHASEVLGCVRPLTLPMIRVQVLARQAGNSSLCWGCVDNLAGVRRICEIHGIASARRSQKSSKRLLSTAQRRAMMALAPSTVQRIPPCLRRAPTMFLQPPSTTPLATHKPIARNCG